MLRIIAMIGDAQASSHVRVALNGHATLVSVRDVAELVRAIDHETPDVVVLGIRDAGNPAVSLTLRELVERFPTTRLVVACRVDADDMHALRLLGYLDLSDLVLVRSESVVMTRRRLLAPVPGQLADMRVRRLVCRRAPVWIRPLVEWCAGHDGIRRPDVRSLARIGNMRRETLARLCKARGVCLPNHLIAWILVLRATARMDLSQRSLAVIARELGLASAGCLANLFVRRAHETPSEARRHGLARLAERGVLEMFGSPTTALANALLTATLADARTNTTR